MLLATKSTLAYQEASAIAVITNSTSTVMEYLENDFVFCTVDVPTTDNLHHYQVRWFDPTGQQVAPWSGQNLFVYVVGTGTHVAHSYLVLYYFTSASTGDYTCKLLYDNTEVHSQKISIRLASRVKN